MKKFVQIVDNAAYWIFEAEELPPYPNPEDFLDITGREGIEEGFLYNSEADEFTAHIIPEPVETQPTIEEKILAENQYQTMLLELNSSGGA
ncbi:hypothetical protein [Lysinibacillus sp. JNUCC-52]|uniref:hypothetical protein n=1 Tax=Lysinibacillus sp. JNUCC-52 TaxID=2792480 RepID=UPI00193625C3|nr:hypothetical protein JNUCC52_02845 [Lysinibacillus sp. JNUCC-52]